MEEASPVQNQWNNRLLLLCVILSFVSVSCNTPKTFEEVKALGYATLAVDIITGLILGIEALSKTYSHIKDLKEKKLKTIHRSLIFDCIMVGFILLSSILQIFEFSYGHDKIGNFPFGLFRIPRAFIMFRIFRYFSFQFHSGRLTEIILRAGHQIGGVTLFLLFFLLLYGLLGVQLFGSVYHCIKNDSDTNEVSLANLAIPDTYCSPDDSFMCPPNFDCKPLNLTMQERGYGVFDNIFISIKTVYEAASQEGWVFLMYENIDSYIDWHSYVYFFTLIFFLAWLVKNVFIAVVIETFAEIRVQLNNVWGTSRHCHTVSNTQVVDISKEFTKKDALDGWRRALHSRWYHIIMMFAIMLNVGITAFRPCCQESSQNINSSIERWSFFGIAELFFTVLFDVEAIVKIICLGFKGYFKHNINKYEALLALMTTINTVGQPHPALKSLSVLRIIRLVKLSPTLESFLYKIFGPAKKIGLLVTFTLGILTFMSTISLQMLCYVEKLERFSTFPQAFMSMFQIMTQEGWIDVMQDAMKHVGGQATYIVISVYFILYHLFVTTVLMSLFVAVILDNLELDENLKRFKQLKVNEQSVDITRPFRLRIFEYFPSRPELISLSKFRGEFPLPRIRNSFLKQFCDTRPPPHRCSTSQCMTGLPPHPYGAFSPIFGVMASTALMSQLTLRKDSLHNIAATQHALTDPFMGMWNNSSQYRRRQKWRRSLLKANNDDHLTSPSKAKSIATKMSIYFKKPLAVEMLMKDCSQQIVASESIFSNPFAMQTRSYPRNHHLKRQEMTLRNNRRDCSTEKQQIDKGIGGSSEALFNHEVQQGVDFKLLHLKRQQASFKRQRQEQELRENHPFFDTPLLIVKRDGKFRKFCKMVVTAQYGKLDGGLAKRKHGPHLVAHEFLGLVPYLDWMMILITVASCASMMMESTTSRIHQNISLQITEYLFAVSMGFELMMRVFANGLYFTPNPTFKGLGTLLDLTTFIVSFLFVCSLSSKGHGNQVLFVLRCLRPLRIFKLVPQMKQVVVELLRSFREIVMVTILLVALMFVFAIFGVQVYGGKLMSCNDVEKKTPEECVGIFYQKIWLSNRLQINGSEELGFWVPRVWTNPRNFNFDSLGGAMLTLFEVLSLKGWIEVRDVIIARMGGIHALYIHLFVFLGCMMGLTLFIGVVIANYNENKGTALLTVDQRRWEDLKSRLKIAQPLHLPKRPEGPTIRVLMYDLAEHFYFKIFIASCVMVRSLLLSMKWDYNSEYAKYLVWISIIFTIVFVLEMAIKTVGMTFSGMICSWRNRYDLVLTFSEIVWIFTYFINPDKPIVYSIGWVLVAFRFFSICGKHATLKMLLMTVAVSVYRSFFIIVAMILLLLCYAYAGVALFGNVKYGENIDRHANFATAPLAVTVLFRIVTGEDWNKIMHDCMVQPPQCTYSDKFWETDCGNVSAALVYFCSFYVIIAYIMLNLLVAIIVENFSLFYTMDEDILFGYNDLHTFQTAWNEVDEKRKGTIPVGKVDLLLLKLNGQLFEAKPQNGLLLKHMCNEMERLGRGSTTGGRNGGNGNKNNDDGLYVTFQDVLMMTAYRSVDIHKSLQLEELLMREKLEAEIQEDVAKKTIIKWMENCVRMKRSMSKNGILGPTKLRSNHLEVNETTFLCPTVAITQSSTSTSNYIATSITNEKEPIEPIEEVPEHDDVGAMKRGKHRRPGLSKVNSSAASFSGKLPSVRIDGADFSEFDLDGIGRESCLGCSFSTSMDGWWDSMIGDAGL